MKSDWFEIVKELIWNEETNTITVSGGSKDDPITFEDIQLACKKKLNTINDKLYFDNFSEINIKSAVFSNDFVCH